MKLQNEVVASIGNSGCHDISLQQVSILLIYLCVTMPLSTTAWPVSSVFAIVPDKRSNTWIIPFALPLIIYL